MTQQDLTDRILSFAAHCGRQGRSARAVAERRGWIDGAGRPTDEGRALIAALLEQSATRTIFRGVA